jgi:hypothetical protein
MIDNLRQLEQTAEQNKHLTFEEYQAIREPAYNIIINDYACKLIEKAKENDETLTLAEAREIAKAEIPTSFIPEWMQNLRINANMQGTSLIYFEAITSGISRIEELLSVALEDKINAYIEKHSKDFKNVGEESVNDNDCRNTTDTE